MGVSAPWSGVRGALCPAMSVFTQPGQHALIKTSSFPVVVLTWLIKIFKTMVISQVMLLISSKGCGCGHSYNSNWTYGGNTSLDSTCHS